MSRDRSGGNGDIDIHKEPWRLFRIMGEFVDGFDELHSVGKAVSVFGSAAMSSRDPYYKRTKEIARTLSQAGYAVITGAGPGVMEAANRGAHEAGGQSIGLNIELSAGQTANRYVKKLLNFRYFFIRRVMFVKYAKAFVVMPGGYGTLDEFSEVVTLIQTKKLKRIPVILVGRAYWQGLIDWLKDDLVARGYLAPKDLRLFQVKETPQEVLHAIESFYKQ
jgi:uncharacterized protein (TIGR00730 family)